MIKAKKLCGIMMLIFILTCANTAFARANVCISGGHYNLVSTSYTVWSTTGNTRSCKHNHAYGNDYEQKRKKLRTISAVDTEMAIVLSRMSIAGSVKA